MTTKISALYDAIVAKIPSVTGLTSHVQLPNAYEADKNPGALLNAGFAVTIGDGSNQKTEMASLLKQHRSIGISLTRQAAATENDATLRTAIEKQMAEDVIALVKALHVDGNINGGATSIVSDLLFEGDSGVQFLRMDDAGMGSYYVVALVFTAIYFENLAL